MTGGFLRAFLERPHAFPLVLALAVGLAFRLPALGRRPMHGDEANQAVKAGELRDTGRYAYDPQQHHGPSLYYLTLPSLWLSHARTFAETSEIHYRLVTALFGAALVLLVWPAAGGLGRAAAASAGVLTAISPAMVYYSRFYIQETLLVFFTFAAMASCWRYARATSAGWAAAAGLSFGLMHATKETWVLSAAAMAAALGLVRLWSRRLGEPAPSFRARPSHVAAAAGAGVLAAALLYSSFGTNPRGLLDSVLAFGPYLRRAGGEGIHDHPWHFYLSMLAANRPAKGFFWSEGLILALAAAGTVAALRRGGLHEGSTGLARFLAFYTIALTAVYSAIPYKTPWCMLGFLHGMILLAGIGAAAVVRWIPAAWGRAVAWAVLAALATQLGWQSYRLNFRFPADQRNPYVYAHTSTDAVNLADLVGRVAASLPRPEFATIQVVSAENYWPLPWYLRRFERVGWWKEVPADPADLEVDMIVASLRHQEGIDALLGGRYARLGIFGLRPEVFLTFYVRNDLWAAFVARQASRGK